MLAVNEGKPEAGRPGTVPLQHELGEKIAHGAGNGDKDVSHSQKDQDYFDREHDTRQQQKIGEKKDNARAHALMPLVEQQKTADLDKKLGHRSSPEDYCLNFMRLMSDTVSPF
jgi:hypothetical protein